MTPSTGREDVTNGSSQSPQPDDQSRYNCSSSVEVVHEPSSMEQKPSQDRLNKVCTKSHNRHRVYAVDEWTTNTLPSVSNKGEKRYSTLSIPPSAGLSQHQWTSSCQQLNAKQLIALQAPQNEQKHLSGQLNGAKHSCSLNELGSGQSIVYPTSELIRNDANNNNQTVSQGHGTTSKAYLSKVAEPITANNINTGGRWRRLAGQECVVQATGHGEHHSEAGSDEPSSEAANSAAGSPKRILAVTSVIKTTDPDRLSISQAGLRTQKPQSAQNFPSGISSSNLRQSTHHKHGKSAAANLAARKERKTAKILAIITGVFIICWLPFFVTVLLMAICPHRLQVSDLWFSIFLWLGYVNSVSVFRFIFK